MRTDTVQSYSWMTARRFIIFSRVLLRALAVPKAVGLDNLGAGHANQQQMLPYIATVASASLCLLYILAIA